MDKTKKKNFRMPSGIRNKLMGAVAMLLVSSIMVVSSTYAWFTLSTAPEVTGITTSVGANGNLEMALLNTASFKNTGLITSNVGDSYVAQDVTDANLTWGNLIDLNSSTYNLSGISLMPAALNTTNETTVTPGSFLKTPVYGPDGRVSSLDANTVSAVYANGSFTYDSNAGQTYGVRAIGVASNLSARQLAFSSAKSSFISNLNSAPSAVASAVNQNSTQFALIAISGEPATYTTAQLAALKAVAEGAKNSLVSIVKAYANAGLAVAAAQGSAATDEQVTALQQGIAGITSASALKDLLNAASVSNYDTKLESLATEQENVKNVLKLLNGVPNTESEGWATAPYDKSTPGATVKQNVILPLIGSSDTTHAYDAKGEVVTPINTNTFANIKSMYMGGGAVGTIAAETGNITLTTMSGVNVYGGTKDASNGALAGVKSTVDDLAAPAGAATSIISDTYGYIIDFAFRTNAAGSSLQLQTSAKNRIYAEDGSALTQGGGSTVKFTYTLGLTFAQAEKLLGAVKLVFLDPSSGTIYARAELVEITDRGDYATADVKLVGQDDADVGTIVALDQNVVKLLSVLVYLDGNTVDNTAVINADASGSLELNLQFSSSAELVPMKNSALQDPTATQPTTPPTSEPSAP